MYTRAHTLQRSKRYKSNTLQQADALRTQKRSTLSQALRQSQRVPSKERQKLRDARAAPAPVQTDTTRCILCIDSGHLSRAAAVFR